MILTIQQQTPEWLAERVGRVTASRVKDVMKILKNGGPGAERKRYLIELVCERLTGLAVDHFVSDAMVWGTDNEKYARAAYEILSGHEVEKCGMALHPRIKDFWASPDGLVNANGLFEAKCPNTVTHIEWLEDGEVPEEHKDQCYSQMACWERDFVDFASYDPRIENYPELQIFVKQLPRNEKRIMEIESGVERFLEEVDAKVQKLLARCGDTGQVREQMQNPKLKEALRKSLEMSPDEMITDADLPEWARTGKYAPTV